MTYISEVKKALDMYEKGTA